MTDKSKLMKRYDAAVENVRLAEENLRAEKDMANAILREFHGIPVGTAWKLRVKRTIFGNREEYEAVLEDVKSFSVFGKLETKPWATAFRIKKDGTLEYRARSVYTDWEVIGPYEAPK